MVTAGIWLIYAGVVLRIFELYAGLPELGLVALLLALYGILLFLESFFRHRPPSEQPGFSRALPRERAQNQRWLAAAYLLLQAPGTPVQSVCVDNNSGETTVDSLPFAAGVIGGGRNTPIGDFQVTASGGEIDMTWTEDDTTFTLNLRSVSRP